MTEQSILSDVLSQAPVLAIIRDLNPDEAVRRARLAVTAGVRCVEVTVETDRGRRALSAVIDQLAERAIVGAGTVRTARDIAIAERAGARFTVSPGLDMHLIKASADAGIMHVPGVATATEIMKAVDADLRLLKAFPAAMLGPDWLRAVAGPFPEVSFIATGGVSVSNAAEFLDAGAAGVGITLRADADQTLAEMTSRGLAHYRDR